jgi:hypothetical protein
LIEMKLNLKDEPKEWRKSATLAMLGLAVLISLLRWRHVLTSPRWLIALATLGLLEIGALWRPRWFRGYHLFSMRLGFAISQFLGRVLLALFFFIILTPISVVLRIAGKDALRLRSSRGSSTYWQQRRDCSPLDRLF